MELYLSWPPQNAANLRTLINCNQWIFNASPSLLIDPDPNSMFSITPAIPHLSYIKSPILAESPCSFAGFADPNSGNTIFSQPDSTQSYDNLYYWQLQIEYERSLKTNGQVSSTFLSQLLDLQEMMGTCDYTNAQNLITQMMPFNTYGQNYLTIYNILLSSRVPEYIPLTQDQINTLTPIASANPHSAGPAVYLARGILWHETGAQFYEPVDRNPPVIFEVKLYSLF